MLDFAENTNPLGQALEKIRDICAFALGMNNHNLSIHDSIPDGPKMKHCKPRRRGGISGSNSGVNSYYPSTTSGAFSSTPSASFVPNGDNVEPLVTPVSRETLLPELQDNLMIELDTITGSREASPSPATPSMLDHLPSDPQNDQDSILMMTAVVKTSYSPEENVQDPLETTAEAVEPTTVQEENRGATDTSEVPTDSNVEHTNSNEEDMDVDGHKHPISEDQSAVTVTVSETPKPETEDVKPSTEQNDKNTPEPSPAHQEACGHPVKVDEVDADDIGGGRGKRKGQETENVEQDSSVLSVGSPDPDNVQDSGKSPFKSSSPEPEGVSQVTESDSQVTEADSAVAKDNVQRKYKRQRRSVPKHR